MPEQETTRPTPAQIAAIRADIPNGVFVGHDAAVALLAEVDALRTGLSATLARWEEQLAYHVRDGQRIADRPDKVSAYRDLMTKAAVYERVIGEVRALLNGGDGRG